MDIIIKENKEQISEELSNKIIELLKKDCYITLASGDTFVETYQKVSAKYQANKFLIKAHVVNLDEWLGLDVNDYGSCQYNMFKDLYSHLDIPEGQLILFNAKAENPQKECDRINELLKGHQFDLALLGVGMDGHLALNEPGVDFNNLAFVPDLDPNTKVVLQKYFKKEMKLDKGITLGIKYFTSAKEMIVVAIGKHKNEIFKKVVYGGIDNQIPATAMRLSNNSKFIVDFECYQGE